MRRLLGAKNVLTTSDKDKILGRFNAAVATKILLIGEEMLFAGDRPTSDKLKHLITGHTMQVELKFGNSLEIESYHRLLLTSNHRHVFQAASAERRFITYDVSNRRYGDFDYFGKLYAIANGHDDVTAAAFLQSLYDRDLSEFDPWEGQQTFAADPALVRQKMLSLTSPLTWLSEVMNECVQETNKSVQWHNGLPSSIGPISLREWPKRVPRRELLEAFRTWASQTKPYSASDFTGSENKFWAEIHLVIPLARTKLKDSSGNRMVDIGLADLRANFRKYLKGEPV